MGCGAGFLRDAAPRLRPRYQGRFYPGWHRVIAGAIDALSARTLTPRQLCQQMQDAAARARKEQSDPNGWDDVAKVGMRGTMRQDAGRGGGKRGPGFGFRVLGWERREWWR